MANYTPAQIKNLWIQAGGSPTAATMAAAIAMAESGGNPDAANQNKNGTTDRGLWQINSVHGSQSTFDPLANAKAAVGISQGGTTWRPWCTAWSTGLCSGSYLGSGSPVFKFINGTGVPTETVGVPTPATPAGMSDMLNPQAWASAFLKPIGTWMFYGAMGLLGSSLMWFGFFQLFMQTNVARTVLSLGTSAATRGVVNPGTGKGQAGRIAKQGVDSSNRSRDRKERQETAVKKRTQRDQERQRKEYNPRHDTGYRGKRRRED